MNDQYTLFDKILAAYDRVTPYLAKAWFVADLILTWWLKVLVIAIVVTVAIAVVGFVCYFTSMWIGMSPDFGTAMIRVGIVLFTTMTIASIGRWTAWGEA